MNRVYLHGVAHVKKQGGTLYIASEGEGVVDEKSVVATGSDTPRMLADRFGDVANVRDFGAVGDGFTDDTEAFEKAAETGKRVFVPQGKYLVTSDVSGDFFSDGEVFTDYSKISIGCQPYIGGVRSVYVDATNGSDFNDGASVLRPVKTMARAINIANAGKSPQTTIYLLGNYVYEVPASMLVFSGVAPHVASYNGSPTLKFMYNGGVGPRFYSTHVNFKGTEDNPLKIDSAFGGLYFEGCSCTFEYTEFLTATGIMGGNITSSNCTYSTLPNAGTDFGGLGRKPALFVYMSNARIYNTTLKSTDGKSTGILFSHGSVGAVYGYLNVVEQSVSETTQPIIKTYNSSINLNFTSNALSFTNKYFRFVNLSWSTMNITSDCYNIIQQLNSIFDESNVFVGENSVYISGFEKGQKISSGYFRTSGYITNDGARIGMTIQLPRLAMPSVKGIDVSFSKITIRGISGYIANGIDKESIGTIIATNNTYFVNVFIELSSSYQKPEINNTPVSVEMKAFVLTAN